MEEEKVLIAKEGAADLDRVAAELISFAKSKKILLFIGEMGAGKTTLIKAIGRALGIIDRVSSPTFSIVNEYATQNNEIVYHFDFYRLTEEEEAMAIGSEEYFDSGRMCLIEWPQIVSGLLPDEFLSIHIEELLTGERKIILKHHG